MSDQLLDFAREVVDRDDQDERTYELVMERFKRLSLVDELKILMRLAAWLENLERGA